jgi:hypothetical protein
MEVQLWQPMEGTMLLGSGLTQAEQHAFDVLLRFFDGEDQCERKALALVKPFACRTAFTIGELSEDSVAKVVMHIIADYALDTPDIELVFGERRDTLR